MEQFPNLSNLEIHARSLRVAFRKRLLKILIDHWIQEAENLSPKHLWRRYRRVERLKGRIARDLGEI